MAALRQHRARQRAEQAQLADRYHHSGYVVTGRNGDPLAAKAQAP